MTLRAMNPAATATKPMMTINTLKPVERPPDFEPGMTTALLATVVEVVDGWAGLIDEVVLLGVPVVVVVA